MRKQFFVLLLIVAGLAACDKSGNILSDDLTIDDSGVSALITTYVSENYPDAEIVSTVKTSGVSSGYLVTLSTSEQISFDLKGNPSRGGGHHYGDGDSLCNHHGGGIPVDSLPAEITGYIAANYADYTIRHARYDTLCQFGPVTLVILSMDTLQPLKLIFDASNLFVSLENRMLSADLPAVVTDFIASSYADYSMRNKAGLFTLADNTLQYKVFLHNDLINFSVVVSADGVLLCEGETHTGGGQNGGGNHGGGHDGGGHHGGGNHGNGHHNGGHQGDGGIPVDSLSATIVVYISANYPGYGIMNARYESICPDGDVITVRIGMQGSEPIKLIFGAGDAFLMTVSQVPYSDVQQAVKDYIAANYADWMVEGKAGLYVLAGGGNQYMISLVRQNDKVSVRITADGTFICSQ